MEGLVISRNEMVGGVAQVEGTFESQPFVMEYNAAEASGTIDGDFDDTERAQILCGWEMQQ